MSSARTWLSFAAFTALCACAGASTNPDNSSYEPGLCLVPTVDPCDTDRDCQRLASAMLGRELARLEADDAGVPRGETRVALCVAHECRYAFAIDDRCYAGPPKPTHEIDCARSDAELLQAAVSLGVAGDDFEAMTCVPL